MLIIGHRGAKGLALENTLESLGVGFDAEADVLEFDVRLTKDHHLVIIHDAHLTRTHNHPVAVSGMTLDELRNLSSDSLIPTLEEVLDIFFGKVLLNIEVKSRGCGEAVVRLLKKKYIKKAADWDKCFVSAFRGGELLRMRKISSRVNLALLHGNNPFIFIAYHSRIRLTAVGFHRLYINQFALQIAKKLGLFTYVYTVNRTAAIQLLQKQGIDGIVTDYPDRFKEYIVKHKEDMLV
jgi:glycerophosphoryl diester phosphodiesterase